MFDGKKDNYNGITVDTKKFDQYNDSDFEDKLTKSIEFWTENLRRSIWFKVDISNSNYVPILVKNGFNFHHAREGFVMMVRWLPKHEPSNIPAYAHTLVGVGGLVVNFENNLVLAIREKQALVPGNWKLPGGYVEEGENFVDAVIREVKEETGIETKFDSIVTLRHSKGFNFGCSDLYIVIALTPLDPSKNQITMCPREISESKWMNFDEYLTHPKIHEINRGFLQSYLNNRKNGIQIVHREQLHSIFKKKFDIYFVEPKL